MLKRLMLITYLNNLNIIVLNKSGLWVKPKAKSKLYCKRDGIVYENKIF